MKIEYHYSQILTLNMEKFPFFRNNKIKNKTNIFFGKYETQGYQEELVQPVRRGI